MGDGFGLTMHNTKCIKCGTLGDVNVFSCECIKCERERLLNERKEMFARRKEEMLATATMEARKAAGNNTEISGGKAE
jgi:hypothetical protein